MHTDHDKMTHSDQTASLRPVGLTGGIASGKSTVAMMFRSLGATTISADFICAGVLCPGSPALMELVQEFGKIVLAKDGNLNRVEMLQILTHQPGAFQKQIDILRPHILPAIDKISQKALEAIPGNVVIVEAPLLFEYGRPERYHPVITVSVPKSIQIERLMKRSGKSELWATRVVDLQWPLKKKESLSDYVITNERSRHLTQKQVKRIYKKLQMLFNP